MAEPVILDGRLAEIFADSDSESDFYGFSPIQSDDSSDDDEILANVRDRLHKGKLNGAIKLATGAKHAKYLCVLWAGWGQSHIFRTCPGEPVVRFFR